MPSFDGRKSELRSRLTGTKDLEPIEIVRITSVLEDFFNVRDSALTTLATIVADTGSDELARDYTDKLANFRTQMNQKLGDMLSGLSPASVAAVQFRERALVEEVGFWGGPGLTGLGAARDELMRRGRVMREMSETLDKKWSALSEEDLRVEQAEEDAAKQVTSIVQSAIVQQADLVLRAGNLAANVMTSVGKVDDQINGWVVSFAIECGVPPDIAALIPKMSSIAQPAFDMAKSLGISAVQLGTILAPLLLKDPGFAAVEWMKALMGSDMGDLLTVYSSFKKGLIYALQTPYVEKVSFYRGLLPAQSAVIVTFTGTRHDADQFIQNNGADKAREVSDRAIASLDTWAGGSMTDGQKTDAAQMRAIGRDALLGRLASLTTDLNNLLAKHNGRLMGPLTTDTERALLNTDVWVVTQNGFVQLGVDDRLRDWRRTVTEIPARIGDSFSKVDRAFDNLPLEIKDRIRNGVDDYLDQTLRKLNSEAQDTAAALDACQLQVNANKMTTDFDRTDLQAKIRA